VDSRTGSGGYEGYVTDGKLWLWMLLLTRETRSDYRVAVSVGNGNTKRRVGRGHFWLWDSRYDAACNSAFGTCQGACAVVALAPTL
jgi:hypothetical protein